MTGYGQSIHPADGIQDIGQIRRASLRRGLCIRIDAENEIENMIRISREIQTRAMPAKFNGRKTGASSANGSWPQWASVGHASSRGNCSNRSEG